MHFIWDQKYSVNIKSIDSQHQRFFEIINQLYTLIDQENFSRDQLLSVVCSLNKYADYHLSHEEKYFHEFKYSKTKNHIASHNILRQKIKTYLSDVQNPDIDPEVLANKIAEFCKNWLSRHILNLDRQYIRFFILHDIN